MLKTVQGYFRRSLRPKPHLFPVTKAIHDGTPKKCQYHLKPSQTAPDCSPESFNGLTPIPCTIAIGGSLLRISEMHAPSRTGYRSPNCRNVDYSGSGVVPRCSGGDNKETNGEFFRSRAACSLESSSNRITCRGDQRVRMIYHSRSLSLTAAADLAVANFDRSRSAKSRTSLGSS